MFINTSQQNTFTYFLSIQHQHRLGVQGSLKIPQVRHSYNPPVLTHFHCSLYYSTEWHQFPHQNRNHRLLQIYLMCFKRLNFQCIYSYANSVLHGTHYKYRLLKIRAACKQHWLHLPTSCCCIQYPTSHSSKAPSVLHLAWNYP